MQLRHGRAVVRRTRETEGAPEGWRCRGSLHRAMHGEQSRQLDVRLQQIQQIAHLEVVDRELEVRRSLRWQEPVRVDAAGAAAAQLEVRDLYALRAPGDHRRTRCRPHGRIEAQLQITQAQLPSVGVENVLTLEAVVPRLALPDEYLGGPLRVVIAHACIET